MKATKILIRRFQYDDESIVELRIWRVPGPIPGSGHSYKYSLAYVVDDVCVLRYDNEAGKGDHRHIGEAEEPYIFTTLAGLQDDFWNDVDRWREENG